MPNVLRRGRVLCVLGTLVAGVGWLVAYQPRTLAQQPVAQEPATPVFRAGVEFVSVDVFPRRDGTLVEGLTADDFQVLEDGTPQRVESFEFVRIEPNPADSERRDPTSQADGDRQAADPHNRVFVVFLDLANTTIAGGYEARQPVVDFLRRTIGARDLFGVMTAETPASQLVFGRRLESIEGELARHWTWGRAERTSVLLVPESDYEERLLNCVDFLGGDVLTRLPIPGADVSEKFRSLERILIDLNREDQLVSSLEALTVRLGGLRDERKNVLFISEGWVPRGPRDEFRDLTFSRGQLPLVGTGPGGRLGMAVTQPQPTADLSWCDTEVQRLTLTDFERRFHQMLEAAAQANVSFYPIDVGGLRTVERPGGAVATLRTLAENTDGFAIVGTNDLTGAVRRIENDLSAYYLLGYYSTNTATNGRFRRIEVKVNDPAVRISARRGYFAMTPEMAAAAAAPRDSGGPTAVDTALARLAGLRLDAELFVTGTAGPDGLDVVVEVAADAVGRQGWATGTELMLEVRGADGPPTTVAVPLSAGERSARVAVPAAEAGGGPWRLRVEGAGRDGRLDQETDVPLPDSLSLVGPARAFRGARSLRAPLQPLADARLSRLERLRVEWAVLEPTETRTVRLLDRRGEPLGQPLPFTPLPEDRQSLAVDLPMGSLPEGDYVLELVVTGGGGSERHLLAFRVVR